jgi:Uma2 family endonuclease
MLKSRMREMTSDEFLIWCLDQEDKYELVDGVPVLLHQPINGQSGATSRHDRIVVNLIGRLFEKLRGSPCRPTTSDQAVRTSIKRFRRPDVTIECGETAQTALEVTAPVAVFEVLSPSNRASEVVIKLEEYKRHPAIRHIVLLEPGFISVTHFTRGVDAPWVETTLTDVGLTLSIDPPGVVLPLTEIYEGVLLDDEPQSIS